MYPVVQQFFIKGQYFEAIWAFFRIFGNSLLLEDAELLYVSMVRLLWISLSYSEFNPSFWTIVFKTSGKLVFRFKPSKVVKPEIITWIDGIIMIIELVGWTFPVIVDMAGNTFVAIEWTTEVAMKVYFKTKEMEKEIQSSLGRWKYLISINHYYRFLTWRLKSRLSLKRLSLARTLSFPMPEIRRQLHFVEITIDLKKLYTSSSLRIAVKSRLRNIQSSDKIVGGHLQFIIYILYKMRGALDKLLDSAEPVYQILIDQAFYCDYFHNTNCFVEIVACSIPSSCTICKNFLKVSSIKASMYISTIGKSSAWPLRAKNAI